MASASRSVQTLVPLSRADAGRPRAARGRARRPAVVAGTPARLRPRNAGEIVDTGCEVLARGFGPCVGTAFLLWLPANAAGILIARSPFVLLQLAQIPLQTLVTALTVAALTRYVSDEVQGKRADIRASLLAGLGRAPGVFAISLLSGAAVAGAIGATLCCGGIPGAFLAQWALSVAPAAYLLEERGVFASLARSVRLVSRSFFRWLGWFLVQAVMALALTAGPSQLYTPDGRAFALRRLPIGEDAFDVVLLVLSSAFYAVTTALLAILWVVYYMDLRVRREGLDLELELAGLAEARAG